MLEFLELVLWASMAIGTIWMRNKSSNCRRIIRNCRCWSSWSWYFGRQWQLGQYGCATSQAIAGELYETVDVGVPGVGTLGVNGNWDNMDAQQVKQLQENYTKLSMLEFLELVLWASMAIGTIWMRNKSSNCR